MEGEEARIMGVVGSGQRERERKGVSRGGVRWRRG